MKYKTMQLPCTKENILTYLQKKCTHILSIKVLVIIYISVQIIVMFDYEWNIKKNTKLISWHNDRN